ncbi:hypothetical protein ES703_42798 [subsurface metagenome]
MRRGLMVVTGESSDFTGSNMIAGTILIFGKAGRGTGVSMKHGINIKEEYLSGAYRRYNGDITELGKGEILLYERG